MEALLRRRRPASETMREFDAGWGKTGCGKARRQLDASARYVPGRNAEEGNHPLRIASEPVEKIKPWNRYLDDRKARAERAKSVPLGSVEWAAEGSVPPLKSKFLDENWNMPACMLLNSLTSLSF
jgi:hypothetical protein